MLQSITIQVSPKRENGNGGGVNEEVTLHPSSIPYHSSVSILVFFIKKILYIYIYIYIYIYMCICIYMQISLNIIDILYLHIFFLDPFEFPYYFFCILGELIYVLSIVACIPSTFCPTLGHHQGRDLLQKWCNFCFSILQLCKGVFAVEGFGVCFWMWFYI